METSSPLAAMHPPAMRNRWIQHNNCPVFQPDFSRPELYLCGQGNLSVREQPRPRSNPDYFSFRPAKGSSPTSTLAVDLSRNFHIDQSPQLPTPRRSLFSANLVSAHPRPLLTTPPISSSSPGYENDPMDLSPLPHKLPHVAIAMCSPTPEITPITEQPPAEPTSVESQRGAEELADAVPFPTQAARRFSNPARPLFRRGQSSTSIIPPKAKQSFAFGSHAAFVKAPLESFAESPPSAERKLPSSNSTSSLLDNPTTLNPFFSTGSPLAHAHVRRPLGPRRTSGISRRTLSMQSNDLVRKPMVRQEKRCCTTGSIPASVGAESSGKPMLPYFLSEDDSEQLPRITKDTLVDLLNGKSASELGDSAIIDCRFEYEYEGGHINGALNFNDKEHLAKQLFDHMALGHKRLIFHCEYSEYRAPIMAKYIRQRDRTHNQDSYPKLSFPEIYILDGGYSSFFKSFSSRCFPPNYVEMDAKEHEDACEVGMARIKRRHKLSRAQTYAFGQQASSPSAVQAPRLPASLTVLGDSMDIDLPLAAEHRPTLLRLARRLDSY